MTTQVVGVESDISNRNLRLVRVHCAVSLCESIALKHVEQRSLAGIVKAEEDDIGRLLEKPEPLEGRFEEIVDKHF